MAGDWVADQPDVMGSAREFYGPSLGLLASLFQRPKSPGFLGESPNSDGTGLPRPGSVLDALFGSEATAPGTSPTDESGFASLAPSTNDPASRQPEVVADGVPVPRPRPVAANAPASTGGEEDAAAPLSIAPPMAPEASRAMAQGPGAGNPNFGITPPSGSLFGNLLRPDNAPLLLALAGGFAGAPSIGTGMRRAFSGAVPAAMQLRQSQLQQSTMADTYRALVAKGVPPMEALAAVRDPNVMKAVAAKWFEAKPPQHVMIKGDLGGETPAIFDPNLNGGRGGYLDAQGKPLEGGGVTGGGAPGTSILKPGVKYDADLPAEDWIKQFDPALEHMTKALVAGDEIPTGNPRMKTMMVKAKELAPIYAEKTGDQYSESLYQKKRTMQTDLARSTAGSMGGILSNGKSAFGHLANLGEKFIDLGSYSGPNIPGGAAIGGAGNMIGNQLLPTPATKGKLEAVTNNALKYGQESTKFYAATGGGAAERTHALDTIARPTALASEQAAFLQTEKELMLERVAQKEAQVRETMGDRYMEKHPIRDADFQSKIDRIDHAIAVLRGQKAPGAAQPAQQPAAPPPGNYVYDPATKRLVPAR